VSERRGHNRRGFTTKPWWAMWADPEMVERGKELLIGYDGVARAREHSRAAYRLTSIMYTGRDHGGDEFQTIFMAKLRKQYLQVTRRHHRFVDRYGGMGVGVGWKAPLWASSDDVPRLPERFEEELREWSLERYIGSHVPLLRHDLTTHASLSPAYLERGPRGRRPKVERQVWNAIGNLFYAEFASVAKALDLADFRLEKSRRPRGNSR
jgi:hypothetical protein